MPDGTGNLRFHPFLKHARQKIKRRDENIAPFVKGAVYFLCCRLILSWVVALTSEA
jgi:hypothetical protein